MPRAMASQRSSTFREAVFFEKGLELCEGRPMGLKSRLKGGSDRSSALGDLDPRAADLIAPGNARRMFAGNF